MKILILFFFLAFPCMFARVALFETVLTIFLLLPVVFYASQSYFQDYSITYYVLIASISLCMLGFGLYRQKRKPEFDLLFEIEPLLVFAVLFLVFHKLQLRWPDFISIGERLRDYALLSSVINSPIDLQEPWLSGVMLNYYGYWYRVGHMLHAVLGLKAWEVYQQLQCVTYSLYATTGFVLFRRHVWLSLRISLLLTVFLAFGSNIGGVVYLISDGVTWWYPSRIIPGTIHEFPAWSFLLGDLHPHYLNLGLIPFLLIVFARVWKMVRVPADYLLFVLYITTLPMLLIYTSNAWEIPIWLGIVGSFGLLGAITALQRFGVLSGVKYMCSVFPAAAFGLINPKRLCALFFLFFLCFSLYVMSRNFVAIDSQVRFVGGLVLRTRLGDFTRHWGLPMFLISVGCLFSYRERSLRIACCVLLGSALLFDSALAFLIVLWAFNTLRSIRALRQPKEGWDIVALVLCELLGFAALTFLMVPEIIFLDDPYGGDIERMNTVFKIYSASWFLVHTFAVYLIVRVYHTCFGNRPEGFIAEGATAMTVALFCLFFVSAIQERRWISPEGKEITPMGLTHLDYLYPGASETILALRGMKKGVVLEAQGNAYSEASHVSTLSDMEAFLGWANHARLLYPANGEEISRREQTTKAFYETPDCETKRDILKREGITYAVAGPFERRSFPQLNLSTFSCLNKVIENNQYSVYTPG